MSIVSNLGRATQHSDNIKNATNRLEGTLGVEVSITNTRVRDNIQEVVATSNNSVNGLITAVRTDASNIFQIGEGFNTLDLFIGDMMRGVD